MRMRRAGCVVLLVGIWLCAPLRVPAQASGQSAAAQTGSQNGEQGDEPSAPALQTRSKPQAPPVTPDLTSFTPGATTLPEAASSAYAMGDPGDEIQLILTPTEQSPGLSRLTGYVSLIQKGTALTYFFSQSTVSGSQVSFATRELHGVSYRFTGEVIEDVAGAHGAAPSLHLRGSLVTVDSARHTEQTRHVDLPSLKDKLGNG